MADFAIRLAARIISEAGPCLSMTARWAAAEGGRHNPLLAAGVLTKVLWRSLTRRPARQTRRRGMKGVLRFGLLAAEISDPVFYNLLLQGPEAGRFNLSSNSVGIPVETA
jgi:hypothetical protein